MHTKHVSPVAEQNQNALNSHQKYDFSTPEEYIREFVLVYKKAMETNTPGVGCMEVLGRFSESFKSELIRLRKIVTDESIAPKERTKYIDDLNSLLSLVCAPSFQSEIFSSIVSEMLLTFPHLSMMSSEEWQKFVQSAIISSSAKTGLCQERCEKRYTVAAAQTIALSIVMATGCTALSGAAAPVCAAGVLLWYHSSMSGHLLDMNDCLAKCGQESE